MNGLHVSRASKTYCPAHFSEQERVRLYITYGYGEIEFREGIVLNQNARTPSGNPALKMKVLRAGRVYDGKTRVEGAYCSVPRSLDKIERGVDMNKPFTRKYDYFTRGGWLVEKLVNSHWRVI